ncbi:MAG TPA: heparinase II/III family protein, partial [Balneolaceae bacterium]|nr:heparinase II/III family protein [Balneolaceae bacterium]
MGKKGLEEVQKAIQSGDTTKACKTLLNYYRNSDSGDWLRDVKQGLESDYMNQARNLLDNRVTLASTTDKIPLQPNGGWMWNYTGPNQDKEFGYSLNGHTYLLALLHAWKQSGEQKFARSADVRIRDWILHNPLPAKGDSVYKVLKPNSNLGWRDI